MKAAPIPFIPRVGPVDYAPPFAKSAVQFLEDGRIKLSLIKGRNPDGLTAGSNPIGAAGPGPNNSTSPQRGGGIPGY